jgi:hypothetical protein
MLLTEDLRVRPLGMRHDQNIGRARKFYFEIKEWHNLAVKTTNFLLWTQPPFSLSQA